MQRYKKNTEKANIVAKKFALFKNIMYFCAKLTKNSNYEVRM